MRNQILLLTVVMTMSCGVDLPVVCAPGQSFACTGIGGCQGGQSCLPNGSGYSACLCEDETGTGGGTTATGGGITGTGGGTGAGGGTSTGGGGTGGGTTTVDSGVPDAGVLCPNACNDSNSCTLDTCTTTGCQHVSAANGATCGATGQTCQGGACQCAIGVVELCNDGIDNNCDGKIDCEDPTCANQACAGAPDQCHQAGVCSANVCTFAVKTAAACDDGNACTLGDSCSAAGLCSGTQKNCGGAPDVCHLAGVCGAGGACSFPVNEGATCTPSNSCTATATCSAAGICTDRTQIDCSDSNPCTGDVCTNGSCGHVPTPAGNWCGTNMVCNGNNACITCTANVACVPANPCHQGRTSCLSGASVCVDQGTNASNGTSCDDSNACTATSACSSGVCTGAITACPAPDSCHVVGAPVCSAATGCNYTAKTDGTACTKSGGVGACYSGVCLSGALGQPCNGSGYSNRTCNTPDLACNQTTHMCEHCGNNGELCCSGPPTPTPTPAAPSCNTYGCCAAAIPTQTSGICSSSTLRCH